LSALLSVENLSVEFSLPEGNLRAPDGVSFTIDSKEFVGIVGESGSGKSVTALAIMGLIPNPPGKIVNGKILFNGRDIVRSKNHPRGREISMVFQNPLNSLNPNLKIGRQLTETLEEHYDLKKNEAHSRVVETMRKLGIPDPETMMNRYPFEYSGGMRQRTMIAMAMLCSPKLLIADEPTTALDVTIQAQILHLFQQLREGSETAVMFITHDLSVVSQIADKVVVMYAGKIAEISPTEQIFSTPFHPYTVGLLNSIPGKKNQKKRTLEAIPGNVPSLIDPPSGCRFHPRCEKRMDICTRKHPPIFNVDGSMVSCWLYQEVGF